MSLADSSKKRYLTISLAFLAIMGVCLLRALPAFERGTYSTEGGEWLARMWATNFSYMIFGARGDYGVLGNMLVIKAADMLTQLIGGHSLAACGPTVQHVLSCTYVALIFTFIFAVLRTYHGWWRAALVTGVMLLAPDLDGENRIFGEANNVGFFNALGIVFLYYDLWLREQVSLRRMLCYALMILLHLFTSPMAGLVAAGFCVLLSARAVWDWKKQGKSLPAILWMHVFTILLAAWTIHQAKPEASDPNSEVVAHTAAVVMPRFWKTFVELAFCRQLLYPLTLNFYEHFTDGRTLALLAALLVLIVWWLRVEYRTAKGKPDWMRLALTLLLLAIAFSMSVVTIWSRGWLTQAEQPYTKLWPARYYLVQTMLSAGFMAILLLRVGDLFPRFRRDAVALLLVLAASFAVPQMVPIRAYLAHNDPHFPAKRWANQLARVNDLHAHEEVSAGDVFDVEMYIEHHFVQVPALMVRDYFSRPQKPRKDLCEIAMAETSAMKNIVAKTRGVLSVGELRYIPRPGATLVTFDVQYDESSHFDRKRRKLWISKLEGNPSLKAATYEVSVPRVQELSKKRLNDNERLLFKVQLWFGAEMNATKLQALLSGARVAMGEKPEESIAICELCPVGEEPTLASLPDDDTALNHHHPMHELFHWAGKAKEFDLKHVSLNKNKLDMKDEVAFEEQAYLRLNPEVRAALREKVITSGKAHYDFWGRKQSLQAGVYSVSLDVSKAGLSTDKIAGLRVEVNRRKDRPERLRVVLHGAANEQCAAALVPSEGEGVFDVFHLCPDFFGKTFAVQKLEVQFEHPQRDREFSIEDIFVYGR